MKISAKPLFLADRSFTLIEMLLGLGIFSIVAVSLYGTLSGGMRLNQRSQDTNRLYREARWSLERITTDLQNSVWYDTANSYSGKVVFEGGKDRVSFVLPTAAGLKRITYLSESPQFGSIHKTVIGEHYKKNKSMIVRYEENNSLDIFVRREESFADYLQSAQGQQTEDETLSPNIREGSLKFSYAYQEGEGKDAKIVWKDTWEEKFLPSGVRVALTFVHPNRGQETLSVEKSIFVPTGSLGQEKS